jgi:hypothetical protein
MADLPGKPPPPVLPPRPKSDPEQFVCPWKPFSLVTVVTSAGVVGGGYLAAHVGGMSWIIAYVLICVTLGLMFTLAGTAWGAAIALTESPRCGIWFVIFPPYMFYYAATRWRWMSQPAVLFLCGMGLAVGAILGGKHLLAQVGAP